MIMEGFHLRRYRIKWNVAAHAAFVGCDVPHFVPWAPSLTLSRLRGRIGVEWCANGRARRCFMFALRMVQLIESHAGDLSDELMGRLRSSERCNDLLRKVPAQELKMRTHEIYRNLSDWILAKTGSEIEERYVGLGMRRAKQGVPFSEFLFALNATKECLWQYLQQEGLLEDPVELLGDIELLHSLERFFDLAAYSASIGYESVHKETGHGTVETDTSGKAHHQKTA